MGRQWRQKWKRLRVIQLIIEREKEELKQDQLLPTRKKKSQWYKMMEKTEIILICMILMDLGERLITQSLNNTLQILRMETL